MCIDDAILGGLSRGELPEGPGRTPAEGVRHCHLPETAWVAAVNLPVRRQRHRRHPRRSHSEYSSPDHGSPARAAVQLCFSPERGKCCSAGCSLEHTCVGACSVQFLGIGTVPARCNEEGLELLRNSVVAARLGEGDADTNELGALSILIKALFKTSAIGEVEPLVLHFRELSSARSESLSHSGGFFFIKLQGLLFNAQLHEVLCIYPPVLGAPSSCSALALRQGR